MYAFAQNSEVSRLLSAKTELDAILIAVNARDKATVLKHSSETQSGAFDWLRHKKQNWQADLLKAPKKRDSASKPGSVNAQPDYSLLAVFHSWHSCESDGDHVYSFESTTEGWNFFILSSLPCEWIISNQMPITLKVVVNRRT